MSPLLAGLAPRGKLVVVGAAPDPISVDTAELIFGGRSIVGSLTGTRSTTRTTWSLRSATESSR